MDFLFNHWEQLTGIAFFLYEVIARKVPTSKDISIINGIKEIADIAIRNKKRDLNGSTGIH